MARRFPISDHCDGSRFFNPHARVERDIGDLYRWWRTRSRIAWPRSLPVVPAAAPAVPSPGRVSVTYIGHATVLLRIGQLTILTDPVFTACAGPFGRLGPRRVRPPGLPLAALPPIDIVLVSHNHYDHLQIPSLREIDARHHPRVITMLGLKPLMRSIGLQHTSELDWWGSVSWDGVRVTGVPAQHFSARTPFDRNYTLWGGFVIEMGDLRVYFAGDTGYSAQFQEIGRRFAGFDVALIPIGAYEPRWFMQPAHVNPAESVRIHQDVGARTSVGIHYGTFHLTDEGIDEPLRALDRARHHGGLSAEEFRVLDFGETAVI